MSASDETHVEKVERMDRTDVAELSLTAARRKVLAALTGDEKRRYAQMAEMLRKGENVGVLRDAETLALANPTLIDLSKHSFAGNGRSVYAIVDPDDPSRLVRNRYFGCHEQRYSEWVRQCVKLHAVPEKPVEDLFSVAPQADSPEGSLLP